MNKEVKIVSPEGYEIDKENSTFECIKFKLVGKKRSDNTIHHNYFDAYFATEKQAKSALAMARISQIMANDERFGGVVTDEEWEDENIIKYVISRRGNEVHRDTLAGIFRFLAFHTTEQRSLFLEENEDLVKDYLML